MGIDTIVIAEHDLVELDVVHELLDKAQKSLEEHGSALHKPTKWASQRHLDNWEWVNPPSSSSTPELEGPLGFSLWFGPGNIYTIHGTTRWGAFVGDEEIGAATKRCCSAIAKVLGSTRLIFVPDSAYEISKVLDERWEQETLGSIEDFLQREFGPPAADFEDIDRNYESDVGHYYVLDIGDAPNR